MTSTHAAIMREKLLKLGFKYDRYIVTNRNTYFFSIIVEEASQMLEVETLIPMFLQNVETLGGPRLKRVVLIGDNHQVNIIPFLFEFSSSHPSSIILSSKSTPTSPNPCFPDFSVLEFHLLSLTSKVGLVLKSQNSLAGGYKFNRRSLQLSLDTRQI